MDTEPARIEWHQGPGEFESLAVALRGVLAAHGVTAEYDELVSVLGLGAAIVAVKDEPDAARWSCYARDMCLMDAAAFYGLRLRELHPPNAAEGLDQSREFSEHFRDSYAPLIRRALAHGQVALAWRGWDANENECSDEWGVILRERDAHFEGFAGSCGGKITRLSEAAEQVYVVEAHEPVSLDEAAWTARLSAAARHCAAFMAGMGSSTADAVSGSAAFDHWLTLERRANAAAEACDWMFAGSDELLSRLSAARRSLARWLRSASHHVPRQLAARARDTAVLADLVADRFEDARSAATAADPQAHWIERLRERDERLVEKLSTLISD